MSNSAKNIFSNIAGNINCRWYSNSFYYGQNPLTVYQKHIKVYANQSLTQQFTTGFLCHCANKQQPNCSINNIGPLYPGQHIVLRFALNSMVTYNPVVPVSVKLYVQNSDFSICQVSSMLEAEQTIKENCTEVNYSILSENNSLCMLVLYNSNYLHSTIYYVKL